MSAAPMILCREIEREKESKGEKGSGGREGGRVGKRGQERA